MNFFGIPNLEVLIVGCWNFEVMSFGGYVLRVLLLTPASNRPLSTCEALIPLRKIGKKEGRQTV